MINRRHATLALVATVFLAALLTAGPTAARTTRPPRNISPPRISGHALVGGKLTATRCANRAPALFASPGTAFCSWTTNGSFRRRAARYAGIET